MTLATLAACVGILGALQTAYLFVKNMEAARQTGGSPIWSSGSDSFFDETEDRMRENEQKLRKDFDLARAKAIMAMAAQFRSAKA